MSMRISLSVIAAILCVSSTLTASVIMVPDDYPSIQQAIDAAAQGDTVLVAPGTYYENLDYGGKAVFVTSRYMLDKDRDWIISTVIDGGGSIVVLFDSSEGRNSVISGFTLTNGSYCIYCDASSPTIQHNRIVHNYVDHWGAGVSCWESASPLISHNLFAWNYASDGGAAVFAHGSTPVIKHNIMRHNTSTYGGAICSAWYSEAYIEKNIIIHNTAASTGGGIHLSSMAPQVINNTVCYNEAPSGAGVYTTDYATSVIKNNVIAFNEGGAGIMAYHYSEPVISYNDVYDNEGGDYVGTDPGHGDISCDPLFKASSENDVNLSVHSPCIDAADPASATPWFGGDRRDMGAREFPYSENATLLTFSGVPGTGEIGSVVAWDLSVTNPFGQPMTFDGWIEVSGPACAIVDTVCGVSLPAYGSYSGAIQLAIPNCTEPGLYTAKGRLGSYEDEIWDGEVFDIELVPPVVPYTQ